MEVGQQKIKTHLSDAIIVALFLCLPLGIVAIVKAVKTSTLLKAGRYAEAEKASANAYKWVWISALVGLIGITVFVVLNMNS